MSPEERALELQSCMRIISDPIRCRALIAQAIRQAENEVIERAAGKLDEQASDPLKTIWGVAAKRMASDIRSLATKDP